MTCNLVVVAVLSFAYNVARADFSFRKSTVFTYMDDWFDDVIMTLDVYCVYGMDHAYM